MLRLSGNTSGSLGLEVLSADRSAASKESAAAEAHLRRHMSAACGLPPLAMTGGAVDFLSAYYCAMRAEGLPVQHEVASALRATAGATARLCGRSQVAECPDCTVAVLLGEATLQAKYGCQPLLGLPALAQLLGRGDASSGTIDGVLPTLHRHVAAALRSRGLLGAGGEGSDDEFGAAPCS